MTKTQARRDRGLCIWCEAPALPDTTRNVAANLALSEGRMVAALSAKEHMRGMPYARLSTLAWWRTLRGEALRESSSIETLHTMRTAAAGAV